MTKKDKSTRKLGSEAEQIAAAYLEKKGYKIKTRNWHFGHLELDIIALDNDELVIVEVKSSYRGGFAHPTDAINKRKIKQIIEAAEAYIDITNWEKDTRFDLIIIEFTGSNNYELEHYEDAFNAEA